jgi:hypothetical protein
MLLLAALTQAVAVEVELLLAQHEHLRVAVLE